jgi:hypothetical protein
LHLIFKRNSDDFRILKEESYGWNYDTVANVPIEPDLALFHANCSIESADCEGPVCEFCKKGEFNLTVDCLNCYLISHSYIMNFDVALSSFNIQSVNVNLTGSATINGDLLAQLQLQWSTNPSVSILKDEMLGTWPHVQIPIFDISFGFGVFLDLDLVFNLTVQAKADAQAGATIQIGYYAVASYNSATNQSIMDANAYIMNVTYRDPQIQVLGGTK